MKKRRYVVCGVSNRAIHMFIKPMFGKFAHCAELVGLLDCDPLRFEVCKSTVPEAAEVTGYLEEDFDRMIAETKPDVVLVAGRDDTHARYILKGLELDLDVVSEKPMVTTSEDCRRVLAAEQASKGSVICTFNCRYPGPHRKIREMILEDKIGRITSIDLNWYIDIYHGASYFKRWNRTREVSGGLSIHKGTHHFDLVNWLIGQRARKVHAFGARNYFGPEGEFNPSRKDGRVCETCEEKSQCKYYMRWSSRTETNLPPDDHLNILGVPNRTKQYSNYRPDHCIFDSEINIEDTYVVNILYNQGAMLSYSEHFSAPYEGYRLAINGTRGRIETQEWHAPPRTPFPTPETQTIDYFPIFGSKETIYTVPSVGGHGGGDPLILEDIFLGPDPQRGYDIQAGSLDAAYAVCIGEAVWKSAKTGEVIDLEDLLGEYK